MRIPALVLAISIALSAAGAAARQTTTGRISGTVADSSGGVLPGATVTVPEASPAFPRTAVTDPRGAYVFVELPIGTYTVRAELQGFKTGVKTGYALVADGPVAVDFSLEVG